jgi:hypothetical protein
MKIKPHGRTHTRVDNQCPSCFNMSGDSEPFPQPHIDVEKACSGLVHAEEFACKTTGKNQIIYRCDTCQQELIEPA